MLFCFAPAVKVNNQVYRAVDNRAYLGAPSCVISFDMTNIGLSGDLSKSKTKKCIINDAPWEAREAH